MFRDAWARKPLPSTFKVDGSTLTGTVTTQRGDMDITNGKIDGDNISFDQVMNFNGNSMTINYKGTADGADSIKFTRTLGDGDRPDRFCSQARCGSRSGRARAIGSSYGMSSKEQTRPAITN